MCITAPIKLVRVGPWEVLHNLIFGYLLLMSVNVSWLDLLLTCHCRISVFYNSFCFLIPFASVKNSISRCTQHRFDFFFNSNVISYFYLRKPSCDLISPWQAWLLRDSVVSVPKSADSVSWGQSVPGAVVVLIMQSFAVSCFRHSDTCFMGICPVLRRTLQW